MVNAKTFVHETAKFLPIKKYGETLCRKEPCNVHVNLTGIAGKPQICAKIEGKYEFKFCRKKHVNISKPMKLMENAFTDLPYKYYKLGGGGKKIFEKQLIN